MRFGKLTWFFALILFSGSQLAYGTGAYPPPVMGHGVDVRLPGVTTGPGSDVIPGVITGHWDSVLGIPVMDSDYSPPTFLCGNCTSGGSGGTGGIATQGARDPTTAQPWYSMVYQGSNPVAAGNALYVQPGTSAVFAVTGTFWQTTQPVSGTFWQAVQPVSGTFWQTTQPVSMTTSAAPGSASTNADTVQGCASCTPVNVGLGGVANSASNPFFLYPGTGATWTLGAGSALVGNVNVDMGGVAVAVATPLAIENIPNSNSATGITPVVGSGTSLVGKASSGNVYSVWITEGSTAGFLAVLNVASAPSASASITPIKCIAAAANAYVEVSSPYPFRNGTGVVLVSTSSCGTYTAVTETELGVMVQ